MKRIFEFLQDHWAEILVILTGFLLLFLLLWFRLGSLTFGNGAAAELTSREAASSWQSILANPLNAPYSAIQRIVMMTGHDGITSMRLVTTLWAIAAMVLFYIVARQWHSTRVAGIATWLFITSSWFLHTARLATPEILWLVGVLALVVVFTPAKSDIRNRYILPLQTIVLGLLLYVPGMVWLVLAGLILQRYRLKEAWTASTALVRASSLLIGAALIAPLGWAMYRAPGLAKQWIGFSPQLSTPLEMAQNFMSVPINLFARGPLDPVRWLGELPLLTVFEALMFIIGTYFYATHIRAARSRFIIFLSAIAWLVIAIGGLASLSLIVPVIYLLVATGIAYMLRQWLMVFPNNPIARMLGIVIVIIAVGLTSIYQTRSYFVAWRYNTETVKAFDQKL